MFSQCGMLYCECAHSAGCAVDQHMLICLQLPEIAHNMKHRETCRGTEAASSKEINVNISDAGKTNTARKAELWVFTIDSEQDLADSTTVRSAASFLEKYSDRFPKGFISCNPAQRAVMAIKVYSLFLQRSDDNFEKDVEDIISRIVEAHAAG